MPGIDLNWAMMKSNGGLMDAKAAADHPIHLAMSGPAGGAVASKYVADLLQIDDMVTLDVGGTSADVGLILGATVGYTTAYEIEWGIPAAIPLIDIHTVGAGGGSIAWVNAGGFLQVGPRSAGADPGPICYGAGGDEVTLTDANLVLGRLDPELLPRRQDAPRIRRWWQSAHAGVADSLGHDRDSTSPTRSSRSPTRTWPTPSGW